MIDPLNALELLVRDRCAGFSVEHEYAAYSAAEENALRCLVEHGRLRCTGEVPRYCSSELRCTCPPDFVSEKDGSHHYTCELVRHWERRVYIPIRYV
jgi:hypothetical protein